MSHNHTVYLITNPEGTLYLHDSDWDGEEDLDEMFFLSEFKPHSFSHAVDLLDSIDQDFDIPTREDAEVLLENFRGAVSAASESSGLGVRQRAYYKCCQAFLDTAVVKEVHLSLTIV